MLIIYGNTTVYRDWQVLEKKPPGYLRIYYVRGGDVVYTDDACRRKLKAGHLYIFPSAAPYAMCQDPDRPLTCTFLHMDVFPSATTELIELRVERDSLLGNLLEGIACAIGQERPQLVEALCDVFTLYCREAALFAAPALPIAEVLRYISENAGRDISVPELSRRIGYNAQYFIRLFKRVMGTTPHQYIMDYRLRHAMRLLQEERSITRVAEAAGYRDLKTFCRAFRQRYGMTPSQFRSIYTPLP